MDKPAELNLLKEIDVLYNDLALAESRKSVLATKIKKFLEQNVYVYKDDFVQNKIFGYYRELYTLNDKIKDLQEKIDKEKTR